MRSISLVNACDPPPPKTNSGSYLRIPIWGFCYGEIRRRTWKFDKYTYVYLQCETHLKSIRKACKKMSTRPNSVTPCLSTSTWNLHAKRKRNTNTQACISGPSFFSWKVFKLWPPEEILSNNYECYFQNLIGNNKLILETEYSACTYQGR